MNSTIDNLNFAVIIDDTEFNNQIKKMETEAKRFNTSMSNLLDLRKQAQQWSQKDVENNRRAWQAKVDEERAQEKINKEKIKTEGLQRKINAQIDQATKGYKTQSRILSEIKSAVLGYLSIHGASQLLSSLVRVTGEFELQKTTLAAMLGDLNAAEQVITRIQGLAVESPFQFKELTTYAKQLSAFSVPAQELYNTTKMLADISAGLGVGMDRIVLAYGQVRSAAFLRGQEVRQFTEAGIPILDELAKQFSELEGRVVSTTEVFDKISSRLVPFEMVAKVFKDMTSEGGKFYNMQEVQAETLKGKISNLKDAYEIMLNEIGQNQSDKLKGAVDLVRRLMQNYEELGRTLVQLVVTYGVTKTATELLAVAFGKLQLKSVSIIKTLRNVQAFALKNPYVLIATGLTAAGVGIYKWATRLQEAEKIQKSVVETSEDYYKSLATETSKLNTLYAKLRLAKDGSEEYAEARKQIYTQYAPYIAQLKEEGKNVQDLAAIYDDLKLKIEESQKAKFRDIASQDIEQTFGDSTSKLLRQTERKIKGLGKDVGMSFNELEHQALIAYATGSLSKEDILNNPELSRIGEVMALPIFKGVDKLKEAFDEASKAYQDGLLAIEKLYGKKGDISIEEEPFVYPINEDVDDAKKKAADRIQEEINAVKRLRDAYQTLAPYMNGEMLRKTLTALFPDADQQLIQSLDFRSKLLELAAELNEFDKPASKVLLDTLSGERANEIASAFETMEQYKKMLDSWLGEDFELSEEGVAFDISKIISNLNSEYAKIDQRRLNALELLAKAEAGDADALKRVRERYGEEVWEKYLNKGKETIEELALSERNAAKRTAQEKVNDLASKWVSENTASLDMQDWGDKSISQIARIKKALESLYDDEVAPNNLKEMAKEAGLSVDDLIAKIRELLQAKIDNTTEEQIKKIADVASDTADIISKLASSLEEFAEASGNKSLETIAKGLQDAIDVLDSAAKGFSQGGWIGAIVGGVTSLISKIAEASANARRLQSEMVMAAIEYELTIQKIKDNLAIDANDTIFGSNALSAYLANLKIAENALGNIIDKYRSLKDAEEALKWAQESFANGEYIIPLNPDGTPVSLDHITELTSDLRTGWQRFWGSEKNMFSFDLNALFDEGGNPIQEKFEELKAWYEAYGDGLSDAEKETVEKLIGEWDRYENAVKAKTDYLNELFGNLASDIASNMIRSFIETGDAVADLATVFEGLGETILQSLLESWILDDILNKYKDLAGGIIDKFAAGKDATEELDALADNIQSETEVYARVYQALMKEFQDRGLLGSFEEGSTDLGQGIKNITEDTANLLASYLNAIRADVSYSKVLWQRMDANTQMIADTLREFSAPTLMDYQKKIESNTYNNMVVTQEILAELRSLVVLGNDGSALRVYNDN